MIKKLLFLLLILCPLAHVHVQRKISAYANTQFTATINDETRGNNPWAAGLGLHAYLNTKSKFKLMLDVTGDVYLSNDKVARLGLDEAVLDDVRSMINVLVGASYHPSEQLYVSYVSGASFINGEVYFGIKPSIGYYFSTNQKWTARLSYINVFNRNQQTGADFGSLSLSVGIKLF